MNKFILIAIIASLLLVPGIWYNFIRDNPISAQETPEGEGITERERIFTPEEVVVCILEVPIGEAIEEAMDFACQLSKALASLQWAVHEYPRVVREIADLAKSCKSDFCRPICVDDTELVCVGVCEDVTGSKCDSDPDECPFQGCTGSCIDIINNICIPGVPCPPGAANCDCVTTPGTCCWDQITTCNCGPPGSCDLTSDLCHEISPEVWCWGHKKCGDAGVCTASCNPVICPMLPPWNCCWMDGTDYCWEHIGQYCTCGDACPPGEPFCYDIGTQTKCWGDNECNTACQEICDVISACKAQPCSGDPCPARPLIEEKFNQLANLSRTIERERSIIDNLLNVKRPEIKKKLDEARRSFEKNAPTVELYELLRGPTPCVIAINNYWVELQDVQDEKVCKSLYNYLICR